MINDYCIVVVFGIYYGFRIANVFRIFIGEGMVGDYWSVRVFGIISVFVM